MDGRCVVSNRACKRKRSQSCNSSTITSSYFLATRHVMMAHESPQALPKPTGSINRAEALSSIAESWTTPAKYRDLPTMTITTTATPEDRSCYDFNRPALHKSPSPTRHVHNEPEHSTAKEPIPKMLSRELLLIATESPTTSTSALTVFGTHTLTCL